MKNVERTYYVIIHATTGKTMPAYAPSGDRGWTRTEPNSFDPPRLFATHNGASKALTAWLKGRMTSTYDGLSGERTGIRTVSQGDRTRTAMRIRTARIIINEAE